MRVILVLLLAAAVLTGAARLRGFEYDEAYSVFVVSGAPRPHWPAGAFTPASVRHFYDGAAGPLAIARSLRTTDVHPPLYFWALAGWRRLVGDGIFAARLLSVLCALVALALVGAIATEAGVPAAPAMVFTLGCYGFAYTGAIARDFALAQALALAGIWLLLVAARRRRAAVAAWGGIALGAASFTNDLAVFIGAAGLLWLGCHGEAARRRPGREALAALAGFALFLPGDVWFFLAQRGSRVGQFPPFRLLPAVARLAKYAAGDLFGGLPLYVSSPARPMVAALLAGLLAAAVALVVCRWPRIGRRETRGLLTLGAVAPPLGLIGLGIVFDTTPIELRYLAFATPFAGLLLAGALAEANRPWTWWGAVIAGVQAVALAGLLTRSETMQPARRAAAAAARLAGADGIVAIPRGNDGVGVVGPFLAEAPGHLHVLVVPRNEPAGRLRAALDAYPRVVLALIGVDRASRATLPVLRAAVAGPCWRLDGAGFDAAAFARTCAARPTPPAAPGSLSRRGTSPPAG